jgi:hypothetical protein
MPQQCHVLALPSLTLALRPRRSVLVLFTVTTTTTTAAVVVSDATTAATTAAAATVAVCIAGCVVCVERARRSRHNIDIVSVTISIARADAAAARIHCQSQGNARRNLVLRHNL